MIPRIPTVLALACAFASATASLAVAQSSGKPLKWACIGNSITAGYIVAATDAYPAKLGKLLGPGFTMENDGVATTTLLKAGDYPYWTHGRLANVFAFKPDIVTIKLGTNDSRQADWHGDKFIADYESMIDSLNTISPKPKIWLVTPIPSWMINGAWPYNGISNDIIKNQTLPALQQVAKDKGLTIIDVNTPMQALQRLVPDGVHPVAEGQDSLAHFIYRAIASSLPTVARAAAHPSLWPEIHLRQGIVSVSLPGVAEARARLFSADGRELASTVLRNGAPASMALSNLAPGPYILSVEAPSASLRAVKALSF